MPSDTSLRLATWNVERVTPHRHNRCTTLRSALAPRAHDVLVLTESHHDVHPREDLRLVSHSTVAPDRGPGEHWVCIWIAEHIPARSLELTGEPERSAAVLLEPVDLPPLLVFGSVLPWRTDGRFGARRGGAAFTASLQRQATDVSRLRQSFPEARFSLLGDLNQELDRSGPVGTTLGRTALLRFLEVQQLVAVTGGARDPLRSREWRESIDHIILDAVTAASASESTVWPERFPLPGGAWPDHHGVEVDVHLSRTTS